MALGYEITENDTRFIRVPFLSISPTSTTIFKRSFDMVTGKFFQPIRVNEETGEVETLKPPTFSEHKGTLSDKGQRNLKKSIYTLLNAVDPNIMLTGKGKEKISFITLTLPSEQIKDINKFDIEQHATDKEIKRNCFNPLLTELRDLKGVSNYVWVAEKQINGSIHFHLLVDKYIDYKWLCVRWNSYLTKYGFIERYKQKFENMTYNQYYNHRLKENNKPFTDKQNEQIKKAYDYGKKTNWTNPNSTDIGTLKHVKNIAAYIAKYMSKGYTHEHQDQTEFLLQLANKQEISDYIRKKIYTIDGRIWQCNQTISKARKCIEFFEDFYETELDTLTTKVKDITIFVEERFTTILHSINQLKQHCNEIYNHYINHIKTHFNNGTICSSDNTGINCGFPSICIPPPSRQIIQQSLSFT